MGSKTIFYCDRCGVEFKRRGFTHTMHIHRKITDFCWFNTKCVRTETICLCEECTDAFYKFLGGKNG